MDYLKLLEHSYEVEKGLQEYPLESRMEFLSNSIFGFITYDSGMDILFAGKALEVCEAVNNGVTFDYIKDPDNYKWFLIMCNMPFFSQRLEWGTSIRGAWWRGENILFGSLGLWVGGEQLTSTLRFTVDGWKRFISDVIFFARRDE